jgi:hypothetical protein
MQQPQVRRYGRSEPVRTTLYGGTKTEMKRLLKDANAINKAQGINTKYTISSFADIVDAIHVVQTEMGITGTTAQEAEETISGSLNMLKGAFQNLMTGFADPKANLGKLIDDVFSSLETVAKNITPVVERIFANIPQALSRVGEYLQEHLGEIMTFGFESIFPALQSVFSAVFSNIGAVMESAMNMISERMPALVPMLVNGVKNMLGALAKKLPELLRGLVSQIPTMLRGLVELVPMLTEAFFQTLAQALPELVSMLPELVPILIKGIGELFVSAVAGAYEFVKEAFSSITSLLGLDLKKAVREIDPMEGVDDEYVKAVSAEITGECVVAEELIESINAARKQIEDLMAGVDAPETDKAAIEVAAATDDEDYLLAHYLKKYKVPQEKIDEVVDSFKAAQAAISTAVFGLGLSTAAQEHLTALVDDGATKEQIETYLTGCGIDPTVADAAANTITAGGDAIRDVVLRLGLDEAQEKKLTELATDGKSTKADIEQYLTDCGVDPTIAPVAAGKITAGGAKIRLAINGLGLSDAERQALADLADGGTKEEIEAYLVSCGVDVTVAKNAADTITAANDAINEAADGVGMPTGTAARLFFGSIANRSLIKSYMMALGVPEGTADDIIGTYEELNQSLGGRLIGGVDALSDTIIAALTDGKADTDEVVSGLKSLIESVYAPIVQEINDEIQAQIDTLDVDSPTYEKDLEDLKEKGANAVASLQAQQEAFATFIDTSRNLSAAEVLKKRDELYAILADAQASVGILNELSATVEQTEGRRAYSLVTGGADTSPEKVGKAMDYAKLRRDASIMDAESAYAAKAEQLEIDWDTGKLTNEQYKAAIAEINAELEATKAEAQAVMDKQMAEIFKALAPEEYLEKYSDYLSLSEIIARFTKGKTVDVAAMREHMGVDKFNEIFTDSALWDVEDTDMVELMRERYLGYISELFANTDPSEFGAEQFVSAYQAALDEGLIGGTSAFGEHYNVTDVMLTIGEKTKTGIASSGLSTTTETALSTEFGKVDVEPDGEKTGTDYGAGLVKGLLKHKGKVIAAAGILTSALIRKMRNELGIQSPSKVAMEIGAYTGEGFGIGMERSLNDAVRSANNIVGRLNFAPKMDLSCVTAGMSGAIAQVAEIEAKRQINLYISGKKAATIMAADNTNAVNARTRQISMGVGLR